MRGSDEDSLLDIPSRTSQDHIERHEDVVNRVEPTTTDRPSFLPPKETVIGKTS